MTAKLHPETTFVHAARGGLAHSPAIDLSTTYRIDDLETGRESLAAQAEGGEPVGTPIYARLHNPTVRRFEEALASAEGAEDAVAYSSGMAAITALLLAAKQRGDHIVAVRPLYGGTDHLLASGLLGLRTTFTDAADVAGAIEPTTSLVFLETPGNPTLSLVDIAEVVAQASLHDVPVAVDNTFATPVLQRPLDLGATYVVHSATKFIGGHGDALGGVIATDKSAAKSLRQIRIATGAVMHPIGGYMLHRGLQTLPLRIKAAQRNAQKLASLLQSHPEIEQVFYPSMGQDAMLCARQMKGPGAVLAFEVKGGMSAAADVMRKVKVITPAVSLGSVDTLIQHPAGLTHQIVTDDAKEAGKITAGLLRLSVGIEDPDDLWKDLKQALGVSQSKHSDAAVSWPVMWTPKSQDRLTLS